MAHITYFRSIAASMLAVGLVACGAPAQPNTSAQAPVTQMLSISAELDPLETPVPVEPATVKFNAMAWTIPQPRPVAPRIAANTRGVLWVLFPSMVTTDTIVRYAMDAMSRGAYQVMYTPFRPEGGDATRGARVLWSIPNVIGDQNVTVGHPFNLDTGEKRRVVRGRHAVLQNRAGAERVCLRADHRRCRGTTVATNDVCLDPARGQCRRMRQPAQPLLSHHRASQGQ